MTAELAPAEGKNKKINENYRGSSSDTVYAVGLIGAWIYNIGRAATTEEKIKGFFKSFVWPGILVAVADSKRKNRLAA
jgi:hypothetical protein